MQKLIRAISEGDMTAIGRLMDEGTSPNAADEDGNRPLVTAAENGQYPALLELLRRNAKLESRDKNGTTALIAASKRGFVDMANALLERGGSNSYFAVNSFAPIAIQITFAPHAHEQTC